MYISAGRFNGGRPVSFARGRHGDLFVVQGHGVRPLRWDGVSAYGENAGMDAPMLGPSVVADGAMQYYVARVDVVDGGAGYFLPPEVVFSGASSRPAKGLAYLAGNGAVSRVLLSDGGRGYVTPPSASVSGSSGAGAAITAVVANGSVAGFVIAQSGAGYTVAPTVSITGGGGSGASAIAVVSGGQVVGVTLVDGGSGYVSVPAVTVSTGGATLFPVTRPHLRGQYDCYYRYVDDTPDERGGPIPSNLSPVTTVDLEAGAGRIVWSALSDSAHPRAAKVELWRTTSYQATTVYRVATVDIGGTHTDDLTDAELTDPDRAGYVAMPILKPNGELNAYRFQVPPTDKAVVVSFQDRLWYAVDTSGTEPNSLYYSEVDEPESVPDVNEIVIQENVRDTDAVTALVPFGASLMAMQRRHCYRVTFAKQPIIDASVNLAGYRGCLNQRCWDLHDGVAYVLDQFGVYALTPDGGINPISEGINNWFQHFVDFAHAEWFCVRFDTRARVLRVFLTLKGDGGGTEPVRVLCYSPVLQAWWEERYPRPITAAAGITLDGGQYRILYASSRAQVYALDEGWVDIADGAIASVVVTDPGTGYLSPPAVCATVGRGAWLDAVLDPDGGVKSVQVRVPGFGYTAETEITFAAPDDPSHPAPRAAAGYVVLHAQGASLPTDYVFRSANYEIGTDEQQPKGARAFDRTISVTYRPTECDSSLELRTYFNGSNTPRPNVVRRDRGVGFVAEDAIPASVLNMRRARPNRGESSGVERARFAAVATNDASGSDRHVAVELSGKRGHAGDVVIHKVDVEGVI